MGEPFLSTSFWVAAALTAACAWMSGYPAAERGWVDRRGGAQVARKPRGAPVPLVGGASIFLGLAAAGWWSVDRTLPWPALAVAFALGLLDDLLEEGLRPRAKLIGQSLAALALACDPRVPLPWELGPRVGLFALAVVSQNAINTFDNADGAATALSCVGLFPSPLARGALLGFLPFNLIAIRRGPGGRAPWAYLGDSGSHLLGIWIASVPSAWPVLLLPLLDLARLVRLRRSRGRAPWQGDRSHLAHRMLAAGWRPPSVALALALLGALAPWGARQSPALGLLGAVACAGGFAWLVRRTPDPEQGAESAS